MAFVDECTIVAQAGNGGDGSASLHSEPFKPRGGPDGGDGGDGGSVVAEVDPNVHDLGWLADHPHQRATHGSPGRSSKRAGASGRDLVLRVPDGTVVLDEDGLVADLVGPGAQAVVARGGRGGRGNAALASSRNRLPRVAEPGEQGEERRLRLELRTVADVGLVGLPNAGKSTLLSRLTAAKPKIGAYPFTTLTPNLGVAAADGDRYVVADVPGLIEGASEGRGLGHRFLRHVVRCPALVLVVDLSAEDPAGDLRVLRDELGAYDRDLVSRPALVVGTKADLVEDAAAMAATLDDDAVAVSSTTGDGLDVVEARLAALARDAVALRAERAPHVVLRPGRPRFTIERDPAGRWRVQGRDVERWVMEANLDDERSLEKLQQRLKRSGVDRRLAAMGAREGDEVLIRGRTFEYVPDATASEDGSRSDDDPEGEG